MELFTSETPTVPGRPRLHPALSVAPMMDWTDRHARYFLRLLLPDAALYTEMVPAQALWHADDPGRFLQGHPAAGTVVLQLGDSEPDRLAYAASLAREWGYAHVNLNVGCPSDRVQSGRFGACLMKEPERVAACVQAMSEAARGLPISVKTRLGVDELDSQAHLRRFIAIVRDAGCRSFVVHARKAWLNGLSPRQNREIPPLEYDRVGDLAHAFNDCEIVLNGGIRDEQTFADALAWADGVMVGREACENPWHVACWSAHRRNAEPPDRIRVLETYTAYVEEQLALGVPLNALLKIPMGLFNGCRGARRWRRRLAEAPRAAQPDPSILLRALDELGGVAAVA